MKRFFICSVVAFILCNLYAYDFERDGLYYEIINDTIAPYEVKLTKEQNDIPYKHTIIRVPRLVVHNNIEYKVTTIGSGALSWCKHLTAVVIEEGVSTIQNFAFYSCDSLKSITIPNSVKVIGTGAISNCEILTNVYIGDSIKEIGGENFVYCPNLVVSITSPIPPKFKRSTWSKVCNTIRVPSAYLYGYTNAEGWKDFGRILCIDSSCAIYKPNYDPKNEVVSVTGCKFNTEYNDAVYFFNNKYGRYYEKDSHTATYIDVNFAGQTLDFMILYFKRSDKSNRNEFCSIEFQKVFKLDEYERAKMCYEYFKGIYSDKYTNGFESDFEEYSYWCGMINNDYDDVLPPIHLSLRKSISRSGEERYYLTIEYYSLNTENLYKDEI
jgi:hypothetical protein